MINQKHRANFINSLADQEIYHAYICPSHNILIREGNKCPECEHDKRMKEVEKEIIKNGLFGHSWKDAKENNKNADQIKLYLKEKTKEKNIKDAIKTKERMRDEDYKKKVYERCKESVRKKRIRRLGHSL